MSTFRGLVQIPIPIISDTITIKIITTNIDLLLINFFNLLGTNLSIKKLNSAEKQSKNDVTKTAKHTTKNALIPKFTIPFPLISFVAQ